MAEILLKIGATASHDDGDVISAFSDEMIRCRWAADICHPVKAGFTSDGLRPNASMSHDWYRNVCHLKYERISRHELRVTDQFTSDSHVLSKTPDTQGRAIHLELMLARLLKSRRHRVFGAPGAELWYGYEINFRPVKLDAVWLAIEAKSAFREADHTMVDWGTAGRRRHLPLVMAAMTDNEAVALRKPLMIGAVRIKTRKHFLNYRDDAQLSAGDITRVLDPNDEIPVRPAVKLPLTNVQEKAI